jgi:hypothetical protein
VTDSPDDAKSIVVPFDGIAGVGIRIDPWHSVNGQRFVGLTFVSALFAESHDLMPDQVLALRDALTEMTT